MNLIKNINWHEVFSIPFWFQIDPSRIHPSETAFLYIGIVLIVLGVIALLFTRFSKNQFLNGVAYRVARILITTGLIEAFWYLLRFENAQALGTKFTAALMLVLGLAFLYWPIKYLFTHYKLDMANAQRQASRDEYLNRKR